MIGVFDSGLGGLSAAAELRRLLPNADLLYLGDVARNPYGTRSPEVIRRYAADAVRFLSENGASVILAACGTVSAVALNDLAQKSALPLYGVIRPSVDAIGTAARVSVLATEASVRSHAYKSAILQQYPHVRVRETACPFFVPMVENGLTDPRDPIVRELVRRATLPLQEEEPDAILLGCTHFPVLATSITALFPHARIISAGHTAASALAAALPPIEASGRGRFTAFLTDVPKRVKTLAGPFLGRGVSVTLCRAGFDASGRIIKLNM